MRVLLLGEGNFSFSLCLARRLSGVSVSSTIVATSYDSREDLVAKYADSFPHVEGELRSLHHVKVMHKVDATRPLASQLRSGDGLTIGGAAAAVMPSEYDHIIFNFPHLGKEDCAAHSSMLGHVMHSAKGVMASHATLYITLSQQQALLWRIVDMGALNGLHMSQAVALNKEEWSQWELKRHHTGKSFGSRVQDCRHYCLRAVGSGEGGAVANIFTMFDGAATAAPSTGSSSSISSSSSSSAIGPSSNDSSNIKGSKDRLGKRKLYTLTNNGFIQESSIAWRCLQCSKLCRSEISVRDHVYSTHVLGVGTADRPSGGQAAAEDYRCDGCRRSFADAASLQQHNVSKHGLHVELKPAWAAQGGEAEGQKRDSLPYGCSICGVCFPSEAELASHCESGYQPVAALERGEVCLVCLKRFADERGLKQHENYCVARTNVAT